MDATELFWKWAEAAMAKDIDAMADLYCLDAIHSFPFREGVPVVEGRDAIRQHLSAGLGQSPVTLRSFDQVHLHRTEDPHTVVVECTFEGEIAASGTVVRPAYIEVLTERDGLIASVRDYENIRSRSVD